MSVNKAIILGRLGQDPELRYTQSGQAVCNLSVATNRKYTRDGKPVEEVEWHRVVAWGKQAENCEKYLSKGRQVYVEGRIQTREWEDKEGNRRWSTDIVAQNVTFLSDGSSNSSGGPTKSRQRDDADDGYEVGFADDDIPF